MSARRGISHGQWGEKMVLQVASPSIRLSFEASIEEEFVGMRFDEIYVRLLPADLRKYECQLAELATRRGGNRSSKFIIEVV